VQISPGSTLLLRGHVDNLQAEKFKRDGQAVYQRASLEAMKLSKDRAGEIRRLLIEKYQVDPKRIEVVGRGWEEPAGTDSAANRRVEVQWFTIE
jgi:NitT/TauT family transport system substrate-binding protein